MKDKIISINDFELKKENDTFYFEGEMRFSDDILLLNIRLALTKAYVLGNGLVLDFINLTACNSTNIQNLNKVFLHLYEMGLEKKVEILGNYSITWQKRGLNNFPLVWPSVEIKFIDEI